MAGGGGHRSISLNPDTVVDTWQRLAKRPAESLAIIAGFPLPHLRLTLPGGFYVRLIRVRKPQGAAMRHYEIVLLIHPDQSEQVPAMLERYKGTGHRRRRQGAPRRGLGPSPAGLHDPEARQGALPVPEHRVQQRNADRARDRLPLQRRRAAPPDGGEEQGRDHAVGHDEDGRARRSPQGTAQEAAA